MIAEPFELRGRKLYQEDEEKRLMPGEAATVNPRQLRAMRESLWKARASGRVKLADVEAELATLRVIDAALEDHGRPIGVKLASADREFSIRKSPSSKQRDKRRNARKARAAGRKPKKSKARKRR